MKQFLLALLLVALIAGNPLSAAKVGGKVAPDGQEIQIDFPPEHMKRNISSRGQGCCVFRSLHHIGIWQGVPQLLDFPEWLQKNGLTGGGYPGNVDERIKKICADRGLPIPAYIQIFGKVADDKEIIGQALASGRLVAQTYGISPTGRYNGQRIAHMTNCNHSLNGQFVIMDNNYVDKGADDYEWMNESEWRRAYTSGGAAGWAIIVLDPGGPPPLPWN